MAEYIRRDIAIAEIQRFANPDEYEIVTAEEIYEAAIAAVDCTPAADVKEIDSVITDKEIEKVKKIVHDLKEYCFCTQSIFHKMGYDFTESDFKCIYGVIEKTQYAVSRTGGIKNELHETGSRYARR